MPLAKSTQGNDIHDPLVVSVSTGRPHDDPDFNYYDQKAATVLESHVDIESME